MAPVSVSVIALALGLFAQTGLAGVSVRKTGTAPTGYEVDFTFARDKASRVLVAGGLYPFTDQWHTGWERSVGWSPREIRLLSLPFRGDAERAANILPYRKSKGRLRPYVMQRDGGGGGDWRLTIPLPSGTYNYAFLVDCDVPSNCSFGSGKWVIDPDNPPFVNVRGDATASSFQVPFDAKFQAMPAGGADLNFDYALPQTDASKRGTVTTVNYTSPGSVWPAPDVHEFALYTPPGYSSSSSPDHEYPILYLSHGGGGNGLDWQNLGRMGNIMDTLIAEGSIEPTVVVMPSFYNIAPKYNFTYGYSGSLAPEAPVVRENYAAHLFPFVEANLRVSKSPSRRAFAGLSLGGRLTYEMLINATDYFNYFGIFSGAQNVVAAKDLAPLAAKLKRKGVFNSYGLYDFTFDRDRSLEVAMNANQIPYLSRVQPWGAHYWPTWQDCLYHFGRRALWKPLPFEGRTGR
ncbi:hypothetical protein MAPG_11645 [Magnaporthiopsis poae ATCC 64411]|uniref:Esterase n=1 Tax=Magnaporthiopsis poae (strain ATCC 64411 / 73-15) TaxID=644358 RepID=A0A0C4EFT8_MAGP6|nr:hypothetical protein MAPG_11645 [Magnaporthiopsis poae ATCC 64411]